MRRGFLTFLLVLAFLPAALELANIHSMSVGRIESAKSLLMEQQRVTNIEHDFESSFWMLAKASVQKPGMLNDIEKSDRLAKDLEEWSRSFSRRHNMEIWVGDVELDYAQELSKAHNSFDGNIRDYVTVQSRYGATDVVVKPRHYSKKHTAVGTIIKFGNTESVYLIPEGSAIAI